MKTKRENTQREKKNMLKHVKGFHGIKQYIYNIDNLTPDEDWMGWKWWNK